MAKARLVSYRGKRPIGIRWSLGKHSGEVSSGTMDRDIAIGEKALLLRDLTDGILPSKENEGPDISWTAFRNRYEEEHVSMLSEGSKSGWTTSANHCERLLKPRRLADIDKAALSKLRGKLLSEDKATGSVSSYMGTLRAALGWAYDQDILTALPPRLRTPRTLKKRSGMRSRPIVAEEFDRIVLAAKLVRPKDYEQWQHFLRGLWHSSLRLDELRRLVWTEGEPLSIDTLGKYPMIRMYAEGHKSGRDCFQPITPEFWELISKRGQSRQGHVFQLPCRGRDQMTRKRVIRVISDIGRRAGVVTSTSGKAKTATSHDIGRRAALTRLSHTLTLSQTQQWARHSDPKTTSEFYIRDEAEALAEAVGWK